MALAAFLDEASQHSFLGAQLHQLQTGQLQTPSPAAQEKKLMERLAVLEKTLAQVLQELEELKQSTLELQGIQERFEEIEARRSVVSTYGHVVSLAFSGENSVFDAEAFELIVSANPHERVSLFSELEFARAAAVGGARGGEILVGQAHVTFGLAKGLNGKAGVLLVPFGNVNIDHYAPHQDTISRPAVAYGVALVTGPKMVLGSLGAYPWEKLGSLAERLTWWRA